MAKKPMASKAKMKAVKDDAPAPKKKTRSTSQAKPRSK